MEIKNDKEAFMAAMTLALCSNTEKECDHYLQYAVKYSQSLSELEIQEDENGRSCNLREVYNCRRIFSSIRL